MFIFFNQALDRLMWHHTYATKRVYVYIRTVPIRCKICSCKFKHLQVFARGEKCSYTQRGHSMSNQHKIKLILLRFWRNSEYGLGIWRKQPTSNLNVICHMASELQRLQFCEFLLTWGYLTNHISNSERNQNMSMVSF